MTNNKRANFRILFVAPCCCFDRGGVETHLRELSKEILKDNHTVTIIAMSSQNSSVQFSYHENLRIFCLPIQKGRIKNFININLYLLSQLKEFCCADIVHYHDYKTLCHWSVLIYPALVFLRKKIYITFHGWEGKVPPSPIVKYQRRCAERMVRGNMCIGDFISKWYGTEPSIVSYGGVRIPKIASKEQYDVVFVGRLENDSGIVSYLQAWCDLQKLFPWMSLIVCGDGTIRSSLEKFVKEQKLRNIQFIGSVSDPQNYVINCKLVFASGYLTILEAFSCRKPVVSIYDNELKKDYLTMIPNSNKIMWIVRNAEEVVSSVAEALTNSEKIEKAYEFALKNSWNEVKKAYYKLWGT